MNMVGVCRTVLCCLTGILSLSAAQLLDDLEVKGGEFCAQHTFVASCPSTHVIQMLNASLGRMRTGKCVTQTPYPDCEVDALSLLHLNCSGLQNCRVEVSTVDKLMINVTSGRCSQDYRLYLETYYRCVPVVIEDDQICHTSVTHPARINPVIHVSSTQGFLASQTTKITGKGSDRCPWRIRGQPGQTIQISLLETHSMVSPGDGVCQIYAYIKEGSLSSSVYKLMDCGYDSHGQVIMSLSESVDITIVDTVQDRNFIIHYQAIGCPDIQPQGGTEVVRRGNKTQVTCGDVIWKLECDNSEWFGELGECNLPPVTNLAGSLIPWPKEWGQELTIVMIISVAVVIAVVIVVVGVCIVRRRTSHDFLPVSQNVGEYGVYGMQGPVVPGKCYYPTIHPNSCGASGSDSSHYTTTMQRRQAYPPNGVTPSSDTLPGRSTLFLQQHDVTQPEVTSCSSCPVHSCAGYPTGTYHDRIGASGWQTFPIRRAEHIYSSPKLNRKRSHDAPYYHELDPQEVERQLREQQSNDRLCAPPQPPPNIPVPPIPQEDELNSEDSGEVFPPPPPPLPPDNRQINM